jgi:hypothetical protein
MDALLRLQAATTAHDMRQRADQIDVQCYEPVLQSIRRLAAGFP